MSGHKGAGQYNRLSEMLIASGGTATDEEIAERFGGEKTWLICYNRRSGNIRETDPGTWTLSPEARARQERWARAHASRASLYPISDSERDRVLALVPGDGRWTVAPKVAKRLGVSSSRASWCLRALEARGLVRRVGTASTRVCWTRCD